MKNNLTKNMLDVATRPLSRLADATCINYERLRNIKKGVVNPTKEEEKKIFNVLMKSMLSIQEASETFYSIN